MPHRVGFSHSFNSENTQGQFAMISISRVKSSYEKPETQILILVYLYIIEQLLTRALVLYNIVKIYFLFSFEEAGRREVRVCSDEGRHPRYLMKNKNTLDISCSMFKSQVFLSFFCIMYEIFQSYRMLLLNYYLFVNLNLSQTLH
jgi:hypothetical protein